MKDTETHGILHFSIDGVHIVVNWRLSIELHVFVRSMLLVIRHEKILQFAL